MKNINRKKIFAILAPIIVVVGAGLMLSDAGSDSGKVSAAAKESAIVTATENGFNPDRIVLKKGGEVTFDTSLDGHFWPASNVHPTHDIYSEFDPKEPIPPNETWSFTFNKPGTYRFHDHLSPERLGRIVVLDESNRFVSQSCDDLSNASLKDKKACWDLMLGNAMRDSLEKAFSKFSELYEQDSDFVAQDCHWFAHRLGEQFYAQKYSSYRDIDPDDFPEKSYVCSYGFYHGWLEHLIRDNQSIEKAAGFCEEIGRKLSDKIPQTELNCYHALGHGFVDEPVTPETWGQVQPMIDPAIEACYKAAPNDLYLGECLEGAYNIAAYWWWLEDYGLDFPEDPQVLMDFCKKQDNYEERRACYYEIGMTMDHLTGPDLVEIAKYANQIEDDEIANTVIHVSAAGSMVRALRDNDLTRYISQCHEVPDRLRMRCIIGLSGGITAHGPPGETYKPAIEFCQSDQLTSEEKRACFDNIIIHFNETYTEDKNNRVCKMVPEEYRNDCGTLGQ